MYIEVSKLIIYSIELVAALVATTHYKKYKYTFDKYFLYYLWYVILTEISGYYCSNILKRDDVNIYIMNTYIVTTFLFFINWYYKIVKRNIFKRIIVLIGFLYLSVVVYDSLTQGWKYYLYLTFIIGSISILIATLFFFSELLNNDEVLSLKSNLRFWIATGMLLFSLGMIPFIIFSRVLAHNSLRFIILAILNVILYGCYSLGFIWSKHHKKI